MSDHCLHVHDHVVSSGIYLAIEMFIKAFVHGANQIQPSVNVHSFSLCFVNIFSFHRVFHSIVSLVKMEKTIRTILDQAQNNNIRHGEHLKALADFYSKVCLIEIERFLD